MDTPTQVGNNYRGRTLFNRLRQFLQFFFGLLAFGDVHARADHPQRSPARISDHMSARLQGTDFSIRSHKSILIEIIFVFCKGCIYFGFDLLGILRMDDFDHTCQITFPVGGVGAHNPVLGFIPGKGVSCDIPIPGSDSGGSQGQIEALTAFGQFIGCFLDFFCNRSIALHQQSEKGHQQKGAPNPPHKRDIGQGILGPLAKEFVDIPGNRQVCPGADRPGRHRMQSFGKGFTDNLALGSGTAHLLEATLNLKLQSIQLVDIK